jgi:LysM repeat protein
MMQDAEKRLGKGELAEVQLALSRLYGNPDLTAEESRQLTELLDQLAGTVIYSRQHLLERPYTVKPGDSLSAIAQSYNVPWQLLAKINGVRDPDRLAPGTQLKVLRGPFEVVVSLERFELTLMLGGRYAGRFPIGIGRDNPQLEGSYTVRKKLTQPPYQSPARAFAGGDPDNPMGKLSIELADRVAIHGTNDIRNLRRADGPGTICLGPRDIQDLGDILSAGSEAAVASRVTVRR